MKTIGSAFIFFILMKFVNFLILLGFMFGCMVSGEMLNVYVVPHSHNDVGWLRTTQEYFDGCVRHILERVVQILYDQPDKKFIWVEIKFFEMWWKVTKKQDLFKTILRRKQIEFVDGGWCMNDEATPTYSGIMHQMTVGHQWLEHHLNVTPAKVGWQLDPFGYSSSVASIFQKMGFTDHVIVRVRNDVKNILRQNKELQFRWRASKDVKSQIDTTILYNHYSPPSGFKWEASWPMGHDWHNNPPVTPENIERRAEVLVSTLKRWGTGYKTNHIIYPFGDDFTFMEGYWNFGNMTLLMNYINERSNEFQVRLKYSLLSEYFENLPRNHFQPRAGDFYPYEDGPNAFWTGYFTSYPIIKESARMGERIARSAETLFAVVSKSSNNGIENLIPLREANAEMQHHDAVTGTAKRHVRQDYMNHITNGVAKATNYMKTMMESLISRENNSPVSLRYLTHHFVDVMDSKVHIVLYNSLGWKRDDIVKIYTSKPIGEIRLGTGTISFDVLLVF